MGGRAAGFDALWRELSTSLQCPFRALVVYDFDEDNTAPLAKAVIARGERRVSLTKNDISRGVVGAITTGFYQVERGPVLVFTADLSDNLAQVDKISDCTWKTIISS